MVTRSGLVSCLPTYGCVQYVGGNWCLFYICDEKSSPICADISPYNSCIVVNTLSRLSTHCRRIFRHGNWIELPRPGENVLSLSTCHYYSIVVKLNGIFWTVGVGEGRNAGHFPGNSASLLPLSILIFSVCLVTNYSFFISIERYCRNCFHYTKNNCIIITSFFVWLRWGIILSLQFYTFPKCA